MPFPTLDESSADPQFATLDEANANRVRLAGALGSLLWEENDVIASAIRNFSRRAARVTVRLNTATRHAETRVAALRRRLGRRYRPSGNETSETHVEERATFIEAVNRFPDIRALTTERDNAKAAYEAAKDARTTAAARVSGTRGAERREAQARVDECLEARAEARRVWWRAKQAVEAAQTNHHLERALLSALETWHHPPSVDALEEQGQRTIITKERERLGEILELLTQ